MSNKLQLFQEKTIRSHWDSEKEEWYFSVIDVSGVLAESDNPRKYWSVLKTRLKKEGSQLATNCSQLKMQAEDGKMRITDVLDTKGILRLIQSIPSKNAEPFKLWLAEVGSQRLDEMVDPEKQNLRDNMTDIELTLAQLAEVTTTAIFKQVEPQTMDENKTIARRGGRVAKNARDNIEEELGKTIISPLNASNKLALEAKKDKE